LVAVNSKANKDRIVTTEITIEVKNLEELNHTLKSIRKVDSVFEVQRKK
jgi:(p)ppGpp synthase/HD superfamily hydrolase